jgi:hypothetical protein
VGLRGLDARRHPGELVHLLPHGVEASAIEHGDHLRGDRYVRRVP